MTVMDIRHFCKTIPALVILALAVGYGCKKGSGAADGKKYIDDLPQNAVVLEVDGQKLTKGHIFQTGEVVAELARHKRPKSSKKYLDKCADTMRKQCITTFYQRTLILASAKDRDLSDVPPQMRKALENNYLKTFGLEGETFADLRAAITNQALLAVFDQTFESELKTKYFLQSAYSNELAVTEEMVASCLDRVVRGNEVAIKTNEFAFSMATNMVERIKAGEDFAALADEYSQDDPKLPGGDMGELIADDLDDEPDEYRETVLRLKDGEVSGVLTNFDGVVVLKMIKRLTEKESETELPAYHLARIYFPLGLVLDELPTSEEVRQVMENTRLEEVQKRIITEMRQKVKVSHPSGELEWKGTEK